MITSWELIMAARTSWHSSEAASGEKQSNEKNGASRFLSLPMKKASDHVMRSEALSEVIKLTMKGIFSPLIE